MAIQRHVGKFELAEAEKDGAFAKLTANPNVTVTAVHDGLTKEGNAVRVVDYIEKIGEPFYKLPIC